MNTIIDLSKREKELLSFALESAQSGSPIVTTNYDEDCGVWSTRNSDHPLAVHLFCLAATVASTLQTSLDRRTPKETFGILWVWNDERSAGQLHVDASSEKLLRNLLGIAFSRAVCRVGVSSLEEAAQRESGHAPGTQAHTEAAERIEQDAQELRKFIRKIDNLL